MRRGPGHRISPPTRRKIERLLTQAPTRSDRQTATLAGVAVDTVSRIRGRLEGQGMLPQTRGRGGPGAREILSAGAVSLGEFLELLPDLDAAYQANVHVEPKVRISLTVSYAELVRFTARWSENVPTFVADWKGAGALPAVPDLDTAERLVAAAAAAIRVGDLDRARPLLAAASQVHEICPGCAGLRLDSHRAAISAIVATLRNDT